MITIRFFRYTMVACVTTTIAICFAAIAQSQTIDTAQVLHGNPRCDHVIAQVMRHGVNQSIDRSAAVGNIAGSTPFGFASIPSDQIGDLQIVSVHRCGDLQNPVGPRFKIVVMNQSQHRVDGVDVSLVALLGAIQPHCPNATVRTCAIEPCTAAEVEITLPIEAISMGNNHGVVIGFQRLVVAIDSHDEWMEIDEANNIQAMAVATIPVIAPVITQVSTEVSQPEFAPSESAPSVPASSVPASNASAQAAIQAIAPAVTTDTVNVDELRMAVEKLGASTAEVDGTTR
ncbi:hypothetical protein Poly51_01970 [Rubripirellula tenax]|uniref:Secreted protein n=1 Tax=Rubripirellula tenax TaxID=2528015 RepID=A0A5C6FJM0_9BACT|nr:hypothetical protein [Rubripirellula tenax]TWU59924.1 hypothetical protein Poly51_01970 [Rubripirellula tenax]